MQAEMRRTIKRLLRKHHYEPPAPRNGGGGPRQPMSLDDLTNLILDQARVLYAYWPEVFEPSFTVGAH